MQKTKDLILEGYERTLSDILRTATEFPEVKYRNPNLEVSLIDSLVDPDETLRVTIKNDNGKYKFTIRSWNYFKIFEDPRKLAQELRGQYPGIDFNEQEWKDNFDKRFDRLLGAYLVEREKERRLGKEQ